MEQRKVFSTNRVGTTGQPHAKRESRHRPYILHKKQLKIIGLNVECKTIRLLENNTGENLDDLDNGNDILDIAPKV